MSSVSSLSLLNDSKEQGWGALLFDGTDETIWNKYIGGKVPVDVAFYPQSTIDKGPRQDAGFRHAIWRGDAWNQNNTPDQSTTRSQALSAVPSRRGQNPGDHRATKSYRL